MAKLSLARGQKSERGANDIPRLTTRSGISPLLLSPRQHSYKSNFLTVALGRATGE
jgi:hypothetical protein